MRLSEIAQTLTLKVRSAAGHLDTDVLGGYASDLMSDVMANAEEGYLWVTLQTHANIVAVAAMKELAGIILINGREGGREEYPDSGEPASGLRADRQALRFRYSGAARRC